MKRLDPLRLQGPVPVAGEDKGGEEGPNLVATRRGLEIGEARGPKQGTIVTPNGVRFTTWAPKFEGKRLPIRVEGRDHPMERLPDGFFTLEVKSAGVGSRYQYVFPERSVPDIASRSQPDGIQGDSVVVDFTRIPRRNLHFKGVPLHEMRIEQIHVGTYTAEGTFKALKARLAGLKAEGINAIQLMGINAFMGEFGVGYDSCLIRSVHSPYGTVEDLIDLIDEAHGLGISIGYDLQYNHAVWEENWLRYYGPYESVVDHPTPWGRGMNFDGPGAGPVRQHLLDSIEEFIDPRVGYGFDFLRLDAFHSYQDDSARHIGVDIATLVNRISTENGGHSYEVAESDADMPPHQHGIRAQWIDGAAHLMRAHVIGHRHKYLEPFGKPGQIAQFLKQGIIYLPKLEKAQAWRGLAPFRMIHFLLGNHDRLMNDGLGRSTVELVEKNRPHLLRLLETIQALAPTVPLYWQGSRGRSHTPFYYMADYQDPEKARQVDHNRTKVEHPPVYDLPESPPPSARATFLASKLPPPEALDQQALRRNAYLLDLRVKHGVGLAWPEHVEEKPTADGSAGLVSLEYPTLRVTGNIDRDPAGRARRGLKPGQHRIEEKVRGRWVPIPVDPAKVK